MNTTKNISLRINTIKTLLFIFTYIYEYRFIKYENVEKNQTRKNNENNI